jgi:hypothetical protein
MRKTILVGAAALALTALGTSPGIAASDGPSASPTAVVSSPGLSAPLDSNGAPVVTPEQKIDPYVRPSVVYITIDFRAWLLDKGIPMPVERDLATICAISTEEHLQSCVSVSFSACWRDCLSSQRR